MYLGRFRQGDEVVCRLTTAAGQTPVLPDEPPAVSVYSSAGKKLAGVKVPARDHAVTPGHFEARVRLDERFPAGWYFGVLRWVASGQLGAEAFTFQVLPGGAPTGQVNAMYSFERPQAAYLVQGRDSGQIRKGKNPRT